MAPLLVRQAEAAAKSVGGESRSQNYAPFARTYHLVTALLSRTGETELGWIAADRSIAAAQRAEDPELIAAGLYRLGHVMVRAGRVDEARHIATTAAINAGIAGSSTAGAISLQGSLLLIAAIAAARQDDRREALSLLRGARQLADQLGEDRNDHWTAFGPSNVRIHATSAAVELSDPNEAIINGELVNVDALPQGFWVADRRCTLTWRGPTASTETIPPPSSRSWRQSASRLRRFASTSSLGSCCASASSASAARRRRGCVVSLPVSAS